MTIKDVIKIQVRKLKLNSIENPFNICRIIIANSMNVNKEYIIAHDNYEINTNILEEINININKIINGYPLQYITHKQEFMKLNFYINEDVLIPQPDTEILVQEVLKICNKKENNKLKILDLCTGSGAIAVSIAKNYKNAIITATDISKKAIEVAKINANIQQVNIKFKESNMFEKINDRYDIIVSNPPYIEIDKIKNLAKDVQHEPLIALSGGIDGLKFYRIIAENSYKYINNKGFLALEIGYNQKNEVTKILQETNKYNEIYYIKDYNNIDRVIIAKIK